MLDGLKNAINKGMTSLLGDDQQGQPGPAPVAPPPAPTPQPTAAPPGNGSNKDTSLIPADPNQPAPTANDSPIVTGRFVPDTSSTVNTGPIAPVDIRAAFAHTEDFRRVVEQFDEDRQTRLEWVSSRFFTILAYLLPVVIAWFVGVAIGDAFSASLNLGDAYNVFAHVVSVSVELTLAMLCLATVTVFKRALKDRSQIGLLIGVALLFVVLSIFNSFAQLFLLEKHITIDVQNLVPFVAVTFRSFASFIIDVACALYLGVTGARSLKKYLEDKRAMINAVAEVNKIEIEMGETRVKAAMDMQQAAMDMSSKAKRAETWNQIEALQAEAMIDTAKRNMRPDEGGSYRRSRY